MLSLKCFQNIHSYHADLFPKLGITNTIILEECINTSIDNLINIHAVALIVGLSDDDVTKHLAELTKLGLISTTDEQSDYIITDNYYLLLTDETISTESIQNTLNIKQSKKSKQEAVKENTLKHLKTSDSELRQAFSDWYDTVVARFGVFTAKSLELNEDTLRKFTQFKQDGITVYDLDISLAVLNIAIVNGYKDIQWAINAYQDRTKKSSNVKLCPNQLVENPNPTTYNINQLGKGY